eukprot:315103-Amphidinium_carterae.1
MVLLHVHLLLRVVVGDGLVDVLNKYVERVEDDGYSLSLLKVLCSLRALYRFGLSLARSVG